MERCESVIKTKTKFWFPEGMPVGSSIYVASSRLGQKLDQQDRWFDALRTLASRLIPDQAFLVTHANTTADRYVRRVAELFGIPLLEMIPRKIEIDQGGMDHLDRSQLKRDVTDADDRFKTEMGAVAKSKTGHGQFTGYYCTKGSITPDRLMMAWADRVFLLSVRAGGNVLAAARFRLSSLLFNEGENDLFETRLLICPELTKPKTQEDLIQRGAIGWYLFEPEQEHPKDLPDTDLEPNVHLKCTVKGSEPFEQPETTSTRSTSNLHAPILALDEFAEEDFLIHWTRRCLGAWPDQGEWQYIDDLLFRSNFKCRGEMQVLCRIMATGRLLSSDRWSRDGNPVVSFSNRRLSEIPELKTFRSHLGRWDFLPYGIAVERDWIADHGGRPVIYGDQAKWEQLDESQRPFFQPSHTRDGKIDWRQEKEWRWLGDLDLKQLPLQSAAVFVASQQEAEQVASLSRWPVVYLG